MEIHPALYCTALHLQSGLDLLGGVPLLCRQRRPQGLHLAAVLLADRLAGGADLEYIYLFI